MYGGTKAELERLIKDAASYTDIQKEMGVTVDASSTSFDNIVNAIAVVQGHLGIAGATAAEAATTIEGSVNSMRAAWENLVTGIADENADLPDLMDKFVESAGVAAENLVPRIGIALEGVGGLINEAIPVLMETIPPLIASFAPQLLSAGVGVVESILSGIINSQGNVGKGAAKTVDKLLDTIVDMLPLLVEAGISLIGQLLVGAVLAIPRLIELGPEIFYAIVDGLISVSEKIVEQGDNIVAWIQEGIERAWGGLVSWFKNLWNSLFGNLNANVTFNYNNNPTNNTTNNPTENIPSSGASSSGSSGRIFNDENTIETTVYNQTYNDVFNKTSNSETYDLFETFEKENYVENSEKNNSDFYESFEMFETGNYEENLIKNRVVNESETRAVNFVPVEKYISDLERSERRFSPEERNEYYDNQTQTRNTFGDIYINVEGAKYNNPYELAQTIAAELQNLIDRKAAVYA